MNEIDFYKEGTKLLYVNRDYYESYWLRLLFTLFCCFIFINFIIVFNLPYIVLYIFFALLGLWFFVAMVSEKRRSQNSKYFLYIINNVLFYERITPEKEGFNSKNVLKNFEIVKFIDEKGGEIKILSNKELPWGKRKIQIAKEYLPYKIQIIKYLNLNFAL
jgi:hypothetical protein